MAFGTLLLAGVILTSVALLLRDIAGIGSAPRFAALHSLIKSNFNYLIEMKAIVFLAHALAAGERGIEIEPVKFSLNH
ncbi:MAG: hypothetical protein ACI8PB_005344 [Desulforhopalus sp.]|jgi:hypothetical protein